MSAWTVILRDLMALVGIAILSWAMVGCLGVIASVQRWCSGLTGKLADNQGNAEFIMKARTDLPDAIAEIRRLREVIEDAPHSDNCNISPPEVSAAGFEAFKAWFDEHQNDCTCWKSRAVPPSTT